MSARRVRALMERTIAGEDISGEPGLGEPILTTERIEVSPEVMVGKSVKVPMSMVERIEAVADACGSDWSKTIRRWIEEGLARDEVAAQPTRPR